MAKSKKAKPAEVIDAEVVPEPADATPDAELVVEPASDPASQAVPALARDLSPDAAPAADDATQEAFAEVTPADDEELNQIAKAVRKPGGGSSSSTALARRDPLEVYMAEARRYPLLSREEEYALAVRWVEEGDKEAARQLVTANLRLVVKIANQYRRGYQNLLDLVQEGNIGLLKAVQKYDPYRGVKLSTYAGWWIRAYVLKYILDTWRMVKIGTTQNQRKLFFNLRKQREALKAAGIEPTPEAIAQALNVSEQEVVEMQSRLAAPDQSLDAPVHESEDSSRTRVDLVRDEATDPEDGVGSLQLRDLLSETLRTFGQDLEGREAEIFKERVTADDPVTLQSLGTRWGVSRERARQLEKRLLLRLREYLQEKLGDTVNIALGHDD